MDWLTAFAKDDFGKVVITVCGTLLVTLFGVFLGGLKDIFTDWWKRRRLIRYHAMLLATTMDQLIDDCMNVVFDPKHEDDEGVAHATAPTPRIEWPSALDWASIPSDLMYRSLLIPGMIKSAEESASFVAEHVAGPPDYSEYFEELEDRYSKIGLSAVHILNRLRDDYGVEFQEREHHDPQHTFEATIVKIKKSREAQKAKQAEFFARMEKSRKERQEREMREQAAVKQPAGT
ncbi:MULTISPECIES: hypothetical protein [unclassified Ensifer]|uniref:hypothetical protein n=1 Tax=unclassified Ensifer TaxID=2633371 RepID=UPI000813CA30|nr:MULTISPECIES: hypothetical protein [unclassified Ensifer]OCP07971.1 hypothetical protein BC362_10195 [Ensifer sp. LC14]OCP10919.1 hypothetical protein BC374_17770 [Ensifer sp. LC13]OCP11536.1 hypothetical protein BBX50_18085 [Ensifer sp. LC11]OCP33354.1 hypothetical protein BC364_16975 [Ensifer sp. LC499]